jgi:subtilisin family serine protease
VIRKCTRAGLAAVLAASAITAVAIGSTVARAASATPRPPLGAQVVTLLTGDTVIVTGPRRVSVRPGPGRADMRFRQETDEHGDIVVLPADAAPLVTAGRLDRRLFDVSELIRDGYDDRATRQLPLIVDHAGAARQSLTTPGTRLVRALPSIDAAAVVADKTTAFWSTLRGSAQPMTAAGLSAAGVGHIWLDGRVRATLDHSVPQIGAPQAWQAGFTGQHTTVAVLDTGIDTTHPDLSDAVIAAQDFTDSPSGTDDMFGHGTHVASIITGNGVKYRGVAPDAELLNGKVLDDTGSGEDSGVIAGMEWATSRHADVVNMSLGDSFPSDGTDPVSQAVDRLTEQTGTLFVVAAGNTGPEPESVNSPGAADDALTVGAVDGQDALAEFSSRGPRFGSPAIKPDITAPGVGIVAARATNGIIGEPVDDQYVRLSGTSMAAPHVAGAAAIVKSQHPDWTAETIKAALMGSAKPNPLLSVYQQGAGRVDLAREVAAPAYATPAKLDEGVTQWPHQDDTLIRKVITYHNLGSTPLTLDIAADVRDPSGAVAPAGMVTVEPSRLTMAAHASATVTVTTDTRVDGPDALYGGVITATGPGTVIRTPIGVTKEVESYNITLHVLDDNGSLTDQYFIRFVDRFASRVHVSFGQPGTAVVRLPKSRYYYDGFINTPVGDTWLLDDFVEPDFPVTRDAELTIDARDGKPVGFVVDRPDARPGTATVLFGEDTTGDHPGGADFMPNFDGYTIHPSRTSLPGNFRFIVEAQLAEPDGTGGFAGSPYQYNLQRVSDGRVPADLIARVHNRDLARVRSIAAAQAPGKIGTRDFVASKPLPFTLTEFYTPDQPLYGSLCQLGASGLEDIETCVGSATPNIYHRGRISVNRWNAAVFGPGFPYTAEQPALFAGRQGDHLQLSLPLYCDQDPNRYGFSATDSGSTALFRDGKQIDVSPDPGYADFTVPADPAAYRLHAEATRSDVSTLTTQLRADWTFRSATVPGADPQPLPLLAIRFAPRLDNWNRAPAGQAFTFPVYLQRNGSATAPRVRTLSVQASYDDGHTWQPATTVASGDQWLARVSHPPTATFVSLRATASDADNNTMRQTIIRAYALK